MLISPFMTEIAKKTERNADGYAVAAKNAEFSGNIGARDRICMEGIRDFNARLMQTCSKEDYPDISKRFGERAEIYGKIADLYGICGERSMQELYVKQSILAMREALAIAPLKRANE